MQHSVGNESKTAHLKKIILDIKQLTKKMGVFILALTLFTLSHLWSHVQASSLVRLNAGLRVARGQSVFVTAGELQFHTDGISEACKVEVVLTEPVTQRVGKLTPQVTKQIQRPHCAFIYKTGKLIVLFSRFLTASSYLTK